MAVWLGRPFVELSDADLFSGVEAEEARALRYVVADEFSESEGDDFHRRWWRVVMLRPPPGGRAGPAMIAAYLRSSPLQSERVSVDPSVQTWPGMRVERALDVFRGPARLAPNRLTWRDLGDVERLARALLETVGLPHRDVLIAWSADGSWREVPEAYEACVGELLQRGATDFPKAFGEAAQERLKEQGYDPFELTWACEVLEALAELRRARGKGAALELEIGWRLGFLSAEREYRAPWPDAPKRIRGYGRVTAGGDRGGDSTGLQSTARKEAWYRPFCEWFQPILDAKNAELPSPLSDEDAADLAVTSWPGHGFADQIVCPKRSTIRAALKWGAEQSPPVFIKPPAKRGRSKSSAQPR